MAKRLLMLILLGIFLLSGCWSRREIEKLAIATIIAYDRVTVDGEDKWMLSTLVIKPGALAGSSDMESGGGGGGGGGAQQGPRVLLTSIGDTVWEAAGDLSTRISREDYIAHVNVIILGERLARAGLDKFIDDLLRTKDIRLNTWLLTTKGKAIDVLKAKPEIEELLSQEILGLIEQNQPAVSKAYITDIKRFVNQLITPGQDGVTSYIEVIDRESEMSQAPKEGESTSGTNDGECQKVLRLRGATVYRGTKLVGYLEDRETRGYLYAIGKSKEGIISLTVHKGEENDVAFAMTRAKSKIVPKVESGQISFHIDIKAEGDLQQHEDPHPIAEPGNIKKIEKATAHEIKSMVEDVLKKAQSQYRADIFGFGDCLHKKHPKVWKQIKPYWREIYPHIDVTVSVQAKIRRTGMITDTPKIQ